MLNYLNHLEVQSLQALRQCQVFGTSPGELLPFLGGGQRSGIPRNPEALLAGWRVMHEWLTALCPEMNTKSKTKSKEYHNISRQEIGLF